MSKMIWNVKCRCGNPLFTYFRKHQTYYAITNVAINKFLSDNTQSSHDILKNEDGKAVVISDGRCQSSGTTVEWKDNDS